jgi:hypothetical protein
VTDLERQVKAFILKALLANNGPMRESDLKQVIRTRFNNVAFTDGDLSAHIAEREENKLIAGTSDPTDGVVWDLTTGGKIKAQQLR